MGSGAVADKATTSEKPEDSSEREWPSALSRCGEMTPALQFRLIRRNPASFKFNEAEILARGVGGQIEFIRGAALSLDGHGRPIITLNSMTPDGNSSIVPFLTQGGGVVCTRAHVHYVVTEYGIAYLFGKTLRQRAYELIRIAHPDFRESLEKAAFERLNTMPAP
nr:unnamed protein product [Spirometra erinaceieuropaei]